MKRRELWYEMGSDEIEQPRTRTVAEFVDALKKYAVSVKVAAHYTPGKTLTEVIGMFSEFHRGKPELDRTQTGVFHQSCQGVPRPLTVHMAVRRQHALPLANVAGF